MLYRSYRIMAVYKNVQIQINKKTRLFRFRDLFRVRSARSPCLGTSVRKIVKFRYWRTLHGLKRKYSTPTFMFKVSVHSHHSLRLASQLRMDAQWRTSKGHFPHCNAQLYYCSLYSNFAGKTNNQPCINLPVISTTQS